LEEIKSARSLLGRNRGPTNQRFGRSDLIRPRSIRSIRDEEAEVEDVEEEEVKPRFGRFGPPSGNRGVAGRLYRGPGYNQDNLSFGNRFVSSRFGNPIEVEHGHDVEVESGNDEPVEEEVVEEAEPEEVVEEDEPEVIEEPVEEPVVEEEPVEDEPVDRYGRLSDEDILSDLND
jgi:hypothetical protein